MEGYSFHEARVEVRGQLVRVDFLSLCSPPRPPRDQTLWKSQSSRETHLGSGPQLKQNRRLRKARVTFFCCSIPVSYHMEAITPHNLGADYSVFDGISSVRNPSSRDSGVTVLHTWLRKSSCSQQCLPHLFLLSLDCVTNSEKLGRSLMTELQSNLMWYLYNVTYSWFELDLGETGLLVLFFKPPVDDQLWCSP